MVITVSGKSDVLNLEDYLEEVVWNILSNSDTSRNWKDELISINKRFLPLVLKVVHFVCEQNPLLKQHFCERIIRDSSECLRWWCLLSDPQCWNNLKKNIDWLKWDSVKWSVEEEKKCGKSDNSYILEELKFLNELEKRLEILLNWVPLKDEHYFKEAILIYCLNEFNGHNWSKKIKVIDQFWDGCRAVFNYYYARSNYSSLTLNQIIIKERFKQEKVRSEIKKKIKDLFREHGKEILQAVEICYWSNKKENQERRIKNFFLMLEAISPAACIDIFLDTWSDVKDRHFIKRIKTIGYWNKIKIYSLEMITEDDEVKEEGSEQLSDYPLFLCFSVSYKVNKFPPDDEVWEKEVLETSCLGYKQSLEKKRKEEKTDNKNFYWKTLRSNFFIVVVVITVVITTLLFLFF